MRLPTTDTEVEILKWNMIDVVKVLSGTAIIKQVEQLGCIDLAHWFINYYLYLDQRQTNSVIGLNYSIYKL